MLFLPDRVQEERPVSPSVSEGVKTNPTSLADMCQQLQYRIQEHTVLHSTPVEDQQALVSHSIRIHYTLSLLRIY